MFALGAFVGPTVSGLLFDSVGFRNSTMFVFILHVIVVSLSYFLIDAKYEMDGCLLLCISKTAKRISKKFNINAEYSLEEHRAESKVDDNIT